MLGGCARPASALLALIATLLVAPTCVRRRARRVGPAHRPAQRDVAEHLLRRRRLRPVRPATGARSPTTAPQALYRLAKIIEASGADVVGVQEPERNTRKLADLLGWYASPQAHVISRFPILDPPGADGLFAYVMPAPGRVVAVANVHLPSTPYGPYQVRKGWPRAKVLELERMPPPPALHRVLRELPDLAGRMPVFLTGDFNSPSHLDWTQAVADSPARGPVRRRVAGEQGAGRRRVRRLLPRRPPRPGGRPRLHLVARRSRDAGQGLLRPHRLGAPRGRGHHRVRAGWSASAATRRSTCAFAKPFPTDHRGVVSTFDVTPGESPMLVSPEQPARLRRRRPLRVRFHGDGRADEVVALVPRGGARRCCRPCRRTAAPTASSRLDKSRLRPGRYDVVLVDARTGAVGRPRAGLGVRRRRATAAAHRRVVVRRRREHPGPLDRRARPAVRLGRAVPLLQDLPGPGLVPRLPLHAHAASRARCASAPDA